MAVLFANIDEVCDVSLKNHGVNTLLMFPVDNGKSVDDLLFIVMLLIFELPTVFGIPIELLPWHNKKRKKGIFFLEKDNGERDIFNATATSAT